MSLTCNSFSSTPVPTLSPPVLYRSSPGTLAHVILNSQSFLGSPSPFLCCTLWFWPRVITLFVLPIVSNSRYSPTFNGIIVIVDKDRLPLLRHILVHSIPHPYFTVRLFHQVSRRTHKLITCLFRLGRFNEGRCSSSWPCSMTRSSNRSLSSTTRIRLPFTSSTRKSPATKYVYWSFLAWS